MQQIMGATVGHSLLPDFHGRPDHFMVQFGRSKISALQDNQGALFERADIGMKGGWLSVAARKANGGNRAERSRQRLLAEHSNVEVPIGGERPSIDGKEKKPELRLVRRKMR